MILLDADGPLIDFHRASCNVHGRNYDPPTSYNYWVDDWEMSNEEFWKPIKELGDKFYDELCQPQPWTAELVEAVLAADPAVYIFSNISAHPNSYESKLRWCERYAPGIELLTGASKHIAAGRDRLLIDDHDGNIEKFVEAGGVGLLFPFSTNKNSHVPEDKRIVVVKQALKEWREYAR